MKRKSVLIIFGGVSSEHEVSRASTASVMEKIDGDRYDLIYAGITKNGRWMITKADADEIKDGSWEDRKDNIRAVLSPDRETAGLITETGETVKVDCVWPVLHGENGEDGTVQGLCQLAGLPYVGPGVLSSAACMDKTVTKILVERTGIRQADYFICGRYEFEHRADEMLDMTEKFMNCGYPLFVKPATAGSSVGITKAEDRGQLMEAYVKAFKESDKVLVEETVTGQEVEVAVLGNETPEASRVGEVLSAGEWYDYESKYRNSSSRTVIPANIDPDTEEIIRRDAVNIYKTMGCRGLSRVDFFVSDDGEVVFNEINTLPGFTKISMYPMLWEATGIPYSRLIDDILSYAMGEL